MHTASYFANDSSSSILIFRSYYSVILGWCGYYFIYTCVNALPTDVATSNSTFYELQVCVCVCMSILCLYVMIIMLNSHAYTG